MALMKVSGGLIGITLNESARSRLFLTAPELARLTEEACAMAGLQDKDCLHHHELSQTLQMRQEKQVKKLKEVIRSYNDPFTFDGEELMSLINQTVMPAKVVRDLCNLQTIGQNAYKTFV